MMVRSLTLLVLLVASAASKESVDPSDVAQQAEKMKEEAKAGLDDGDKEALDDIPKPSEILKTLKKSLTHQLNLGIQPLNAVCALVIGIVMLISGEFVFKYLVVGFITLFVFLLSTNVMQTHYSTFPKPVNIAFSTEVAAFIGAISFLGYEGIQLLIGGIVGALLFYYGHQEFAGAVNKEAASTWYFFLFGINLSVLIGVIFFFVGKFHTRAMAIVSSFVGGLFVSSSISFFVMLAAVANREALNKSHHFGLTNAPVHWIEFLWMTVGGGDSSDVGLFQNFKNTVGNTKVNLDAWIGRGIWFFLFLIGMWVQRRNEKTRGKKQTKQARGLDDPLLDETA